MKFKAIWDITEYDADVFLGLLEQEPFQVEAETIEEAIIKANQEAATRFGKQYGSDDYSLYKVRKLIDENAIEYPMPG